MLKISLFIVTVLLSSLLVPQPLLASQLSDVGVLENSALKPSSITSKAVYRIRYYSIKKGDGSVLSFHRSPPATFTYSVPVAMENKCANGQAARIDLDGDLLLDRDEENIFLTDPASVDTDGDGYTDFEEIIYGYNPSGRGSIPQADVDSDGLQDISEVYWGTAISDPDTDGDGRLDGVEVRSGQSPLYDRVKNGGYTASMYKERMPYLQAKGKISCPESWRVGENPQEAIDAYVKNINVKEQVKINRNLGDEQITVMGIVRWEDGTPAAGIPMSCGRSTLANGEFYCHVLKSLYSGSGVKRIHPKGFHPQYSKEPWYYESLTKPVEAQVHGQYTEFVLKRNLSPEQVEQAREQSYKEYLKEKKLIDRKRLRYEEFLKEKRLDKK